MGLDAPLCDFLDLLSDAAKVTATQVTQLRLSG